MPHLVAAGLAVCLQGSALPAGHPDPLHMVSNLPRQQVSQALSCPLTQGSSFVGPWQPPCLWLGRLLPRAPGTCSETQLKAAL